MRTLNLVYPEKSDIKYTVSRFPDGQQQVTIDFKSITTEFVKILPLWQFQIKGRLNNFSDLELLICATKSLRNLGAKSIELYVPYFLGSRSDRKFEEGGNNYLKDVICPIINSLNLESVTVIDPHSDVLEACLNNIRKYDNWGLVNWILGNDLNRISLQNFLLISPDAGANKKLYKLAEQIGYEGEIITCSKIRDIKTGAILETVVPESGFNRENKDFIIIDDICDGGRTFIEIAKVLKTKSYFTGKLYLVVTHGIFSKGFGELSQYFDAIYCTNSYKDIVQPNVDMKVNQLNIF